MNNNSSWSNILREVRNTGLFVTCTSDKLAIIRSSQDSFLSFDWFTKVALRIQESNPITKLHFYYKGYKSIARMRYIEKGTRKVCGASMLSECATLPKLPHVLQPGRSL